MENGNRDGSSGIFIFEDVVVVDKKQRLISPKE